ncbi:MAG: anaerobic ribonucleoside-triphosphate reductase activating protein [Thermodesulfobacteriota bacterium]|jgi:pyruvate formate lyase activating enzyme
MRLAGLQKNSLINYPGKVSSVLFLSGCNFDCPYCHNPDLVRGNLSSLTYLDEETVCEFLESRQGFLDGVVISGGEPTLNKNLFRLCEKIKQMGYPIKLDTNGSKPQVIKRLIHEGLVDYIAMDIKTDPLRYSPLITRDYDPSHILTSIHTIMEMARTYEFRTTCAKPIVAEQNIENIAKTIRGATLYVLQRFRNGRVLHPEYFRGDQDGYDEDGLTYLKSKAEPWVKKCMVR